MLTGGHDYTAVLSDAATGQLRNIFRGHEGHVFSAAFSPDGTKIATAGNDRTARLWEVESGLEIARLRGHHQLVWSLQFSSDGKTLATASQDNTVSIWDAEYSREFESVRGNPGPDDNKTAAFSPDGQWLAVSWHSVSLWDPRDLTKKLAFKFTLPGFERDENVQVAFSSDGKRLAALGRKGFLRVWNVADWQTSFEVQAHEMPSWAFALSPDSKTVATTGGDDGLVKLWNIEKKQLEYTFPQVMSFIRAVTFSPDGRTLVVSGRKKSPSQQSLSFWDVKTRTLKYERSIPVRNSFVVFSPDGKTFATGEVTPTEERVVNLWDAETAKLRSTMRGHREVIYGAAFSPDSKTLASASWDGTVRLWHVATGSELITFKGHTKGLMIGVTFSPDGKQLVGACERDVDGNLFTRWIAGSAEETASKQ